ncbi:hypothetical protein [Sphingobium boeckii]|uniref:Uncharacterized protein n=1 Tax=Sphingobium boeckii TaxID=1082345 RepID=A0A7W9EG67_9SPHN|nr:hypothetical protein [Sphingobium boeckii]MBB5686436.1 hypothetical protein [Sphingobium boeckii]
MRADEQQAGFIATDQRIRKLFGNRNAIGLQSGHRIPPRKALHYCELGCCLSLPSVFGQFAPLMIANPDTSKTNRISIHNGTDSVSVS